MVPPFNPSIEAWPGGPPIELILRWKAEQVQIERLDQERAQDQLRAHAETRRRRSAETRRRRSELLLLLEG